MRTNVQIVVSGTEIKKLYCRANRFINITETQDHNMIRIYLFSCFILICYATSGQSKDDSAAFKLFNNALDYYNKNDKDSALFMWSKIVDQNMGKETDVYGNSFFNIPTIYLQIGNYGKAKEWYKKVLESDLKDNDETGDIMEPHTNYKHKSAVALAGLYERDSNFSEAFKWLSAADTTYRYWGFEGSSDNINEEENYLVKWESELLVKLNRKEEAIRLLVSELIFAGESDNYMSKCITALVNLADKKVFKQDFENAINNLTIAQVDATHWVIHFTMHNLLYTIPVSNVYPDRNLPHFWKTYFLSENITPEKKVLIHDLKQFAFYKEF
jgi:tetratricopeptide (TPR) repeat protein